MGVEKLTLLPAGFCHVDRSIFDTRLTPGEKVLFPVWMYLIETTDGLFLVDTGMPDSCIADPNGMFAGTEDGGLIVPEMSEADRADQVLALAGYQPDDLNGIISTHWHFDHAGGNTLFPDTEIIVQRAEYDIAMEQGAYPAVCRSPHLNYRIIEGDTELVPGVSLIHTPGHTPGHQSVLVRTRKSGNILLTIDAVYVRANYEEGVPFAVKDEKEAAKSIARLKEIAAAEQAAVFFGHDLEQGKEWRKYPQFYS